MMIKYISKNIPKNNKNFLFLLFILGCSFFHGQLYISQGAIVMNDENMSYIGDISYERVADKYNLNVSKEDFICEVVFKHTKNKDNNDILQKKELRHNKEKIVPIKKKLKEGYGKDKISATYFIYYSASSQKLFTLQQYGNGSMIYSASSPQQKKNLAATSSLLSRLSIKKYGKTPIHTHFYMSYLLLDFFNWSITRPPPIYWEALNYYNS